MVAVKDKVFHVSLQITEDWRYVFMVDSVWHLAGWIAAKDTAVANVKEDWFIFGVVDHVCDVQRETIGGDAERLKVVFISFSKLQDTDLVTAVIIFLIFILVSTVHVDSFESFVLLGTDISK